MLHRLVGDRAPSFFVAWLLIVASLALATSAQTWWYPLAIAAAAGLHLFAGLRLPGRPTTFLGILLTVPFGLWLRYLPREGFGSGFFPIDVLFLIGFYCLALGLFHLLTTRTGGNREQAFGLSISAFALAGTSTRNEWYLPLLLAFMPLVILHLWWGLGLLRPAGGWTWRDVLRQGAAVPLFVLVAVMVHQAGVRQIPIVSRWAIRSVASNLTTVEAGFSRTARLGSVPHHWDETRNQQIVLRYWSDRPHEHLRGAAFNRYEQGLWRLIAESHEARAEDDDNGRGVFELSEAPADEAGGTVYPIRELGESLLMPLGVHRFSAFGDEVTYSEAWTVRSPRALAAGGYRYFEPLSQPPPPVGLTLGASDGVAADAADLDVPEEVRGPLARLATQIASPSDSPDVKAAKIAAWFQQHFTYRIGLELTTDKDPVVEFLEDIRAGHCEYFAASATLLLRTMGVPARYVTGFVARESIGGGCYVARRKDAHAWVEMWVEGKGWQTFDPTPPAAQPQPPPSTAASRLRSLLGSYWHRFVSIAAYGGLRAVLAMLWAGVAALLQGIPLTVWGAIGIAALLWIYRGQLRRLVATRRRESLTPHARELRAKLQRAERLLARHGLRREPGTPVGAFLRQAREASVPEPARLEALALLEEYQRLRFRPQPAVPPVAGELADARGA